MTFVQLGVYDDVLKSKASRHVRTGMGKIRNRRHVQRRGPLIVFDKDEGITRAFRNLNGVSLANVTTLSVLELAPGGHLGRLIVWSQAAFKKLEALFGSEAQGSTLKKNYHLPRATVTLPDLARLIKSNEITSAIRAPKKNISVPPKVNPLTVRCS